MSNVIQNDHELNQLAHEYAQMIIDEERENNPEDFKDYLETYGSEKVWEFADNSEHVIYTHKAHAICQNCNTHAAQEALEELHDGSFLSYDELAHQLAFLEIKIATQAALDNLILEL